MDILRGRRQGRAEAPRHLQAGPVHSSLLYEYGLSVVLGLTGNQTGEMRRYAGAQLENVETLDIQGEGGGFSWFEHIIHFLLNLSDSKFPG